MSSDWAEVDTLLRELGGVRAAADVAGASREAKAAIEVAILRAADALDVATTTPRNRERLTVARQEIERARQAIGALAIDLARSARARAQAAQEVGRARTLMGEIKSSRR
jgi:hypothetical protein